MKGIAVGVFILAVSIASAGDLKGVGEFSGFGGGISITDGGGNHALGGGSVGFGVASRALVYGEYSYSEVGQLATVRLNDFQGGLKFSLLKSNTIEPYALLGLGGARFSLANAPRINDWDLGLHAGIGGRFYVNRHWGISPEIRWGRYFDDAGDTNFVRYTGGIFFQWGK